MQWSRTSAIRTKTKIGNSIFKTKNMSTLYLLICSICLIQLDVSGECKTTYQISGPTIVKQKLKCENLEIAGQHSNENEVFKIKMIKSVCTVRVS